MMPKGVYPRRARGATAAKKTAVKRSYKKRLKKLSSKVRSKAAKAAWETRRLKKLNPQIETYDRALDTPKVRQPYTKIPVMQMAEQQPSEDKLGVGEIAALRNMMRKSESHADRWIPALHAVVRRNFKSAEFKDLTVVEGVLTIRFQTFE
jgi:hypothetical protein